VATDARAEGNAARIVHRNDDDGAMKLAPVAERVLSALALAALGVVRGVHRLGDFDLPWHLAYGRIVVTTGSVPRIDDLAYTHRRIVHAEFVSDALLYLTQRAGGEVALQALGAIVATAAFLVAFLSTRRDASALVAASAGAAAAYPWMLTRPATVSFLFLAIVMWALRTHRSAPDARRGRIALAALVPVHALWANMHGFVVVGVALVVGYVGCRVLARLVRDPRAEALLPPDDAKGLPFAATIALLTTLAACVNVAGPRLLLAPFVATSVSAGIAEWMRPSLSFAFVEHPASGVFLVLTLVALAFGRDADRGVRVPTLFDAFVVLTALALATSAVRLIAPATILLVPIVAIRLTSVVRPSALMRGAAVAAAWLVAPAALTMDDTSIGKGFEPAHFPERAVRFIERVRPEGHMWNFMPFGGYLSWRLYPQYRVLLDGRQGWVHDPALTRAALRSETDPSAFAALVRDYHIEWAVCRAREGERFCVPPATSREWAMIHWDDVSAVYVRRGGPNERLLGDSYQLVTHLTTPDELLRVALAPGERAAALGHDARLAASQEQASVRTAFLSACAAIAESDAAAFTAAREALVDRGAPPQLIIAADDGWRMTHVR
jgi:hypothetical protein